MTIDNDKVVSVEYELKDTQTNDILDSNLGMESMTRRQNKPYQKSNSQGLS